jgi:hypothetical protein
MSYAMHAVSMLLGDDFVELLKKLPDEYFKLDEGAKTHVWEDIKTAVFHGEIDTDKLAKKAVIWL